jgi:hypothetical protein
MSINSSGPDSPSAASVLRLLLPAQWTARVINGRSCHYDATPDLGMLVAETLALPVKQELKGEALAEELGAIAVELLAPEHREKVPVLVLEDGRALVRRDGESRQGDRRMRSHHWVMGEARDGRLRVAVLQFVFPAKAADDPRVKANFEIVERAIFESQFAGGEVPQ